MNIISIPNAPTIPNVVVNEALNTDSQKVLFPKKLEKANKFWEKAGIPDHILFADTPSKGTHTTTIFRRKCANIFFNKKLPPQYRSG